MPSICQKRPVRGQRLLEPLTVVTTHSRNHALSSSQSLAPSRDARETLRYRLRYGWVDETEVPEKRREHRIDHLEDRDASGMSRASLHRHFLAITAFSPSQYHKHLRLQEAD